MKLEEYLDKMLALVKENPKAKEMDVVYSRDDEGNGFEKVHYDPTLGEFKDEGEFDSDSETPNAVCIN